MLNKSDNEQILQKVMINITAETVIYTLVRKVRGFSLVYICSHI